ncbi:MAG: hypothetical protein V3V28_08685 [Polaribacter sp.]|uniref:hypothetical protein n=1 Tax=Polaribacter sp. TaxID=1920175 RepID=UPI002F350D87
MTTKFDIDKKLQKLIDRYDANCNRLRKKSALKLAETPKEKNTRIKELEKEYIEWFEHYFNAYAKVKCAPFHKKLAKLIIDNPTGSTLAEIYRSGAKSVHINLGIPLYLYLVKKELFFMLLVGQTENKAKKLLSDIQANLEYNQRIISDYGKRYKTGNWINGDFRTSDGVKFFSLGYGQNPRGIRELAERPDFISVDDLDSKKRVKNNKLSDEAVEWVWEDLQGTFDEGSPRRRFVVSNNNFHKNTVINRLKIEFKRINKIAKEFGDPIEHFTITVPAVKDLKNFEPAWEAKTDEKYWRKKYRKTPYRSFMREYMHVHIVEGKVFKNEDVVYKQRYRFSQYDALCFYGDLSYTDAGDYKGLIFIGKKGREYNILAIYNRQGSRALCAEWLYNIYEDKNLQKYNISYFIEGTFAMHEFVDDFDEEGDKRGYHIPVEADTDTKGEKYDRIEAMAGHYKRKSIYIDSAIKEDTDTMLYKEPVVHYKKAVH